MRIDVFTIFPDMVTGYTGASILGRAVGAGARSTCACTTSTPGRGRPPGARWTTSPFGGGQPAWS